MNEIGHFGGAIRGKKDLVTGHTGFKGSWLTIWLLELGAEVVGFSLEKYPNDYLFKKTGLSKRIIDERGDIASAEEVNAVVARHAPSVIFHLAAQPLVRDSYAHPMGTIRTNVLGTANILEVLRARKGIKAAVIITTDKCYKNREQELPYREEDELGGHDPYSASKACAEFLIASYRDSFYDAARVPVASARAGNVIGGGDTAKDRLIPDCISALREGKKIRIRNPSAVRPWQHVLEATYGYLLLCNKLLTEGQKFAQPWNIAPDKTSVITVRHVVERIISSFGTGSWEDVGNKGEPHEAKLLLLDNAKAKAHLGYCPIWDVSIALEKTLEWYKRSEKEDGYSLCAQQIHEYCREAAKNG